MAAEPLLLPYDPEVDSFGSRTLRTESGEEITYEVASKKENFVKKALQVPARDVPIEFTMFVLRKMAVSRDTFRGFEASLPLQARAYLSELISKCDIETTRREVHDPVNDVDQPSCFRGTMVKTFCKKVICNHLREEDNIYDGFTAIFPFELRRRVRLFDDMDIVTRLDDRRTFFPEIQTFLNRHFHGVDARQISIFFLCHIRTFIDEHFSAESLLQRLLRLRHPEGEAVYDYLSDFPRLNEDGIKWFEFLYQEFDQARTAYGFDVSQFFGFRGGEFKDDDRYFYHLPEVNFAYLYSFLDDDVFLHWHTEMYVEKFKQYLFFFVHALQADYCSRKFFIDDMLFECVESLRRYKTVLTDIGMKNHLAKIALLHYRLKFNRRESRERYLINDDVLENIINYLRDSVLNKEPQLNVTYPPNLGLSSWMSFRTNTDCVNVSYSKSKGIKNLSERLLCCVLCPENEQVQFIVFYNAYLGIEVKYAVSQRMVENLKNFIRLCNKHDPEHVPAQEPDCITRIIRRYCL